MSKSIFAAAFVAVALFATSLVMFSGDVAEACGTCHQPPPPCACPTQPPVTVPTVVVTQPPVRIPTQPVPTGTPERPPGSSDMMTPVVPTPDGIPNRKYDATPPPAQLPPSSYPSGTPTVPVVRIDVPVTGPPATPPARIVVPPASPPTTAPAVTIKPSSTGHGNMADLLPGREAPADGEMRLSLRAAVLLFTGRSAPPEIKDGDIAVATGELRQDVSDQRQAIQLGGGRLVVSQACLASYRTPRAGSSPAPCGKYQEYGQAVGLIHPVLFFVGDASVKSAPVQAIVDQIVADRR